uniref:Uncharacterized protein n=1 Tax=Arundo donax TaxID=35708 RepID=A0A0A9BJW8_ARUDO
MPSSNSRSCLLEFLFGISTQQRADERCYGDPPFHFFFLHVLSLQGCALD